MNDVSAQFVTRVKMARHFEPLWSALQAVQVEENGFETVLEMAKKTRNRNQVYFIGNGGSAAVASHMAIDWLNKGKFAALCFNDAAALTCIGNDHGYRYVFDFQLMRHAMPGDLLFAISSSGRSASIIEPARNAAHIMDVVTLSGFEPDNALRQLGKINFYVPSKNYGTVEIAHLAILHALIDELTK